MVDGELLQEPMGQRADGSIVMLVIDGRSLTSGGATLKELQEVLLNTCNVVTAINLDGGKSTTMYLNGKVINNPNIKCRGEIYSFSYNSKITKRRILWIN